MVFKFLSGNILLKCIDRIFGFFKTSFCWNISYGLKEPVNIFFSSGFKSENLFNPMPKETSPFSYFALCSMTRSTLSLNNSKRNLFSSSVS